MDLSLTEKEFLDKAQKYNVVSLYTTCLFDLETPVSLYIKSGAFQNTYSFLLESVAQGTNRSQYSIIGLESYLSITGKEKQYKKTYLATNHSEKLQKTKPLEALEEVVLSYNAFINPNLPLLVSGAVGFFTYDCIRHYENIIQDHSLSDMEQLESRLADPLGLPDLVYLLPQLLLLFDHTSGSIKVVANIFIENQEDIELLRQQYLLFQKKMETLLEDIYSEVHQKVYNCLPRPHEGDLRGNSLTDITSWSTCMSDQEFYRIVDVSKEYICAGDVFQVVPSRRFYREYDYDPFFLYRALRVTNPSPYMFYLNFPEIHVVGSSPEILTKVVDDRITLRPIAGTIHRGKNDREDKALTETLLSDPKEIAEHVMLVDLGRNDVGRVSEYGTVHVEDLMVIEKYSHVMHIVSNVVGKLKKGLSSFDALRATFPAGTMTGTPKVRAMEIIEELETEKRGLYSGTVGFYSFNGEINSCIVIRTMVVKEKTLYVQAGVGIVYDSVPEKEHKEVYNKCLASFRAVELAYKEQW